MEQTMKSMGHSRFFCLCLLVLGTHSGASHTIRGWHLITNLHLQPLTWILMALEMNGTILALLNLRESMGLKWRNWKSETGGLSLAWESEIIHREVNLGARPVVQQNECKRVFHMFLLRRLLWADALCLGLRPGWAAIAWLDLWSGHIWTVEWSLVGE